MSIFGKMDAATIPTNPFWIEAGEYKAEVTDAKYQLNRNDEKQLVIEYTIIDSDSEFVDKKAKQYFVLVEDAMTAEAFLLLPLEQKQKIRREMANLKRTLCGSGNNSNRRGLGVDVNDLNDPEWDPAVLKGLKVDMTITNYGPNDEGINVKYVNLSD